MARRPTVAPGCRGRARRPHRRCWVGRVHARSVVGSLGRPPGGNGATISPRRRPCKRFAAKCSHRDAAGGRVRRPPRAGIEVPALYRRLGATIPGATAAGARGAVSAALWPVAALMVDLQPAWSSSGGQRRTLPLERHERAAVQPAYPATHMLVGWRMGASASLSAQCQREREAGPLRWRPGARDSGAWQPTAIRS
jgi:hypothetical protein